VWIVANAARAPGAIPPASSAASTSVTTSDAATLLVQPSPATIVFGWTSRPGPGALAALATIHTHARTPALVEAAAHFGVPLRTFTRREIDREKKRLATPSATVEAAIGLAGVCEAVAIKAGTLIMSKQIAGNVTCALGRADTPIDISRFGKSAL
jgi:cobalt-precorrin 5A hydrolase/precorrin-3B C17-methyltransferase